MRLTRIVVVGMAVALALSACGGGGGDAGGGGGGRGGASSGGLEKTELLIGVVPVASSASLFIAEKRGFFKEEGLTVKTEIIQAPTAVMPKIVNGSMDAFLTSYVSLMTINDSGAAKLKLFQHTMGGAPGFCAVVVSEGSPIRTVADLKGRTIAVNVLRTLGHTVVNAHLQQAGLKPDDVKFVAVPFADQLGALAAGKVDAAWLAEPFLSAAKKDGAVQIVDTIGGPTEGVPIDGWGVTEQWLAKYPKTAAALHRALAKGQQVAGTDRKAIDEVVPTYTQIPADVAAAMRVGEFTMEADRASVQKLADLMHGFGFLKARPDVGQIFASTGG